MSQMTYPEAKDLPTKAYARASSQGIWLGRDHEGGLTTTKDFSLALPCDSKEQALALWDELCSWASGSADGKPAPKWSLSKPAIFMGVDHAKAPSSLSAFLAMCQGRFVTLKETPGGASYSLTPNIAEAAIFSKQESAMRALESAMPASDKMPQASVLPLRAHFGAPIQASPHGDDPLASSMAAASARALIEPGARGAELGDSACAPAPARRPKSL